MIYEFLTLVRRYFFAPIFFPAITIIALGLSLQAQLPAVAQVPNAPVINPGKGCFYLTTSVSISAPGAVIYYTTDGSTPTTSSPIYSSSISVSTSKTIKAIAVTGGGTSSVASAYIEIDPNTASVSRSGMQLWLKADNGVTTSSSSVSSWLDMSTSNNHAAQSTGANQPTLVGNAVNGKPAISFNGSGQFMSMAAGFNYFHSGANIFIVTKPTAVAANARFFELAAGATSNNIYVSQPNNTDASFYIYNGSTPSSVTASNAVTLNQYQLLETSYGSSQGKIYTDGVEKAQGTMGSTTGSAKTGTIGADYGNSIFFEGEIAEILIYNQSLSNQERENVEAYFYAKYGIKVNPPKISPAYGVFPSSRSVTITGDPGALIYYTQDGSTPTTSSTLYTGSFSVSATKTIKAIAVQSFGSSSVSSAYIEIDPFISYVPYSVRSWFKADNGVVTDGSDVVEWKDMALNSQPSMQSNAGHRPTLVSNAVNGKPAVNFNGSNQFLKMSYDYIYVNPLTVAVVAKPTAAATDARIIEFSNGTISNSVSLSQPTSTGLSLNVYSGSTPSSVTSASGITLNQFQVLETTNGSGTGYIWTDGVLGAQGSISNPSSTTRINNLVGTDSSNTLFFEGQIAEILVYQRILSDSERQKLEGYLYSRYAIKVNPPVITPNYGVYSSYKWVDIAADPGALIYYTQDGSTPTTSSTLYTGSFTISTTKTIKAIAVQPFGTSPVSSAHIQIDPLTASLIRSYIKSWFKTDNGIITSGSDVTQWNDMSDEQNNAKQTDSGKRPVLVSGAINGFPAIRFNGSDQFLDIGAGFANMNSGGSILAVVKPTAVNTGARLVEIGNGATSNNIYLSQPTNTGLSLFTYNGSTASSLTASNAVTLNQFQVLDASYSGTSPYTGGIYKNGTMEAEGNLGQVNNITRNNNFIGTNYDKSAFFTGDIAELIVYGQKLSETDRYGAEGYLMAKYALGVQPPRITPAQGVFYSTQTVIITADPGATIHYTLDGTTPSTSSPVYSGSFYVSTTKTVKAIAVQSFGTSPVSSAFVQIDPGITNVSKSNLALWFKADNGVVTSGSDVTTWLDMSGNLNNAKQINSGNRPTVISNAVNGLPAVAFDGSSQFLKVGTSSLLNSYSGISIFAVTKPVAVAAGARFLDFSSGASGNNIYFSQPNNTDASIHVLNGTTPSSLTASNAVSLGDYQLLEVVQGSSSATIYNNGVSKGSGSVSNAPTATRTDNFIGTDFANSLFLQGEIAELLFYNTAISPTVRQNVENYLLGRYALAIAKPVITPGYGVFHSSQSVSMSALPGSTIYYTTNGSTPTTSSTQYTAPFNVTSSTTVKAIAVNGSGTSAVTEAYIQIDATTANVSRTGMVTWLKADNGVAVASNKIAKWLDMSPAANNAVQTESANQPGYSTNVINGLPAATFSGSAQYLQFGEGFSYFSGATVFIVTKPTAVTANARFFDLGNGATDNNIYFSQPSNNAASFHVYNGSTDSSVTSSSAVALNQYQVLEAVHSGSNLATVLTDGIVGAQGSINNISGVNRTGNFLGRNYANTIYFQGQIAEIIIYNRSLSASERNAVRGYLYARYAIKVSPPAISPDHGVFASTQNVTITADPGATIYYTTDGSTPTTSSTPYTAPFNVTSSKTVKAIAAQSFGTSTVSSSYIQIDSSTANVSRSGLTTWLKADNGVSTSGSDVTHWQDMTTSGNDAIQPSSGNRPTLVTNAVSGLPALAFNGSSQFMQFATGFATFTSGSSIFVVTKPAAVTAGARFLEFANGTADNNIILSQPSNNAAEFSVYNGSTPTSVTSSSAITLNQYQMLEAVHSGSLNATIYTDGAEGAQNSVANIANVSRTGNFLGRDFANSKFFEGEIAEILIYNRSLSTNERKNVEDYLAFRYGITVAPPVISPGYGVFSSNQTVTITAAQGADIYYTTDGSTPTISSTHYTGSFTQSTTATIKAIAVQSYGSSTVASAYLEFDATTASVTRAGIVTWLKANNGVSTSGSDVITWKDLSSTSNSPTQPSAGSRPTLVSSAINGHPAIEFNGSTQFLQFGSGFNSFSSGASIFIVTKPTAVTANARLFDFGNGATDNNFYLSQPNNTDFSFYVYSNSSPTSVTATSAVTLNQYQVLEAVHTGSTTASLFTTGTLKTQGSVANIATTTRSGNFLGRDYAGSLFFQGQIAEVIIYNKALTAQERKGVESYLFSRYAIAVSSPIISPDRGVFSSSQSVSMTGDPGASIYYTTDGSTPTTSSTLYTGPFSVTSTSTVKAIAVQTFGTSSVADAFIQIDSATSYVPRNNLVSWFKSDNGVNVSSNKVTSWLDMSFVKNDALQLDSAKQPSFVSNAISNLPSLQFDGTADFLQLGPGFTLFNAGASIFIVTKPTAVTAGARFIDFGNGSTDNNINLSQPSSTEASLYVYNGPTASYLIAPGAVTLNQFQVLNANHTGSTSATLFTNIAKKAEGSVYNINSVLRTNNFIGTDYAKSLFFNGEVAEILVYNRALSDSERQDVDGYLFARYQLFVSSPRIYPIAGVYTGSQTVIIKADPGAAIYYTTDGTTPTTSSTLYTTPINITTSTRIRAIAVQSFGTSAESDNFIQIALDSMPVSRTGMLLWLKSDFGVLKSGSAVTNWVDMSGSANNAIQPNSGNRPLFSSDALTGHSAITFDGSSQFMQLGQNFSNFTQGTSAFIVTKPASSTAGTIFDLGNGAASNNIIAGQSGTGSTATFKVYNGSTPSDIIASSALDLNRYQLLEAFQTGSGTGSIAVNAATKTSGTLSNPLTTIRTSNWLGSAYNGASSYFNGGIAELILYNRLLTAGERGNVETYLLQKYQLNTMDPPAPIVSVPSGTLPLPTLVAISAPSNCLVYYTTDGSTPTTSSTLYSKRLAVYFSQTIKAIAVKNGITSAVTSATYTLNASDWPAPDAGDTTPLNINIQKPQTAVP